MVVSAVTKAPLARGGAVRNTSASDSPYLPTTATTACPRKALPRGKPFSRAGGNSVLQDKEQGVGLGLSKTFKACATLLKRASFTVDETLCLWSCP